MLKKKWNIPTKFEKNRTKPGNPHYLVLFENRTKPGTVLLWNRTKRGPLYLLSGWSLRHKKIVKLPTRNPKLITECFTHWTDNFCLIVTISFQKRNIWISFYWIFWFLLYLIHNITHSVSEYKKRYKRNNSHFWKFKKRNTGLFGLRNEFVHVQGNKKRQKSKLKRFKLRNSKLFISKLFFVDIYTSL